MNNDIQPDETDTAKTKAGVSCYSAGEGAFMQKTQAWRGRVMGPFLKALTAARVSPNHLTFLSLLCGLAFCPFFLWGSKPVAYLMLLLHVLLDGLDGPLARYQDRAGSRGSFTDTLSDQIVVACSTISLIAAGFAGAWPGGLYLFVYTVVVVFAMVRSAMAIPYSWLFRPRFIIYLWIPVEVYLLPGSMNVLLWLFTALLTGKMLTGFIRIRRMM